MSAIVAMTDVKELRQPLLGLSLFKGGQYVFYSGCSDSHCEYLEAAVTANMVAHQSQLHYDVEITIFLRIPAGRLGRNMRTRGDLTGRESRAGTRQSLWPHQTVREWRRRSGEDEVGWRK